MVVWDCLDGACGIDAGRQQAVAEALGHGGCGVILLAQAQRAHDARRRCAFLARDQLGKLVQQCRAFEPGCGFDECKARFACVGNTLGAHYAIGVALVRGQRAILHIAQGLHQALIVLIGICAQIRHSGAVGQPIAVSAPAAPCKRVFGIGHQVERRQHVGGHAALVVADVAAHRLAIGQRLSGNLRG